MRSNDMLRIGHQGCHDCAPKEWRRVPKVTNDYDFDATIQHRANKDLRNKLEMYVVNSPAYGPRGYGGYRGYHGDD
jgi:hypothetical protein